DADRDAGRRHLLAGEALDQPVIAPAAHHGAEPDGLAAIVTDRRGQFRLEHGAGVIFQATHYGGIDTDTIAISACHSEIENISKFLESFLTNRGLAFVESKFHALKKIGLVRICATNHK